MPETTFLDANELVINMGPQHPATHGVLRVKLKLDGERVLGSECIIGYLHRGIEKIAENRNYVQFAPYVDRMDYVAAVTNGMGYVEAVEKLLGAEVPPRAQYTRTILAELQRIASHLLWLGTHALDLGAMTPVFYTFREREEVLRIFEKYCGARLTTHAFRIGGLQYDLYLVRLQEMRQSVRIIRQCVERLAPGPILGKVGKVIKPAPGEVYHSIEGPKGELGYFVVSDGTTTPYRVRVRPPSFVNLQAFDKMIRGHLVADVVAIIGTIDIVLGEVDR